MKKFAKSIVEIWLGGGPSSLESFDPKPDAPREYNGGLKAIRTSAGFSLSEWCPRLAQCADLYSVVRTLTHPYFGHETAAYLMRTGRHPTPGIVYPSIGATVAAMKRKNYGGDIPPYVILTATNSRFSEIGFLGEEYAPLVTGGDPNANRFVVNGIVPPGGLSGDQIRERFRLAAKLDQLPADRDFEAAGKRVEDIVTGSAAQTFDLSLESPETRERYGRNKFGQSLLAARRLVEYGVPYIAINDNRWDSHHGHFQSMVRPTAEVDQGVSALLSDLKAKGLLGTTIVWVTGEFGRTPRADWGAPWNGGRGHYARCFSALVAGGGFKGGCAVGQSDETASTVKERAVTPPDFLGSIFELAGIEPEGTIPNRKGLKVTVTSKPSEIGRLREIYA